MSSKARGTRWFMTKQHTDGKTLMETSLIIQAILRYGQHLIEEKDFAKVCESLDDFQAYLKEIEPSLEEVECIRIAKSMSGDYATLEIGDAFISLYRVYE